jgi:hypothetical protein
VFVTARFTAPGPRQSMTYPFALYTGPKIEATCSSTSPHNGRPRRCARIT